MQRIEAIINGTKKDNGKYSLTMHKLGVYVITTPTIVFSMGPTGVGDIKYNNLSDVAREVLLTLMVNI